ncbi:MAG: glycoside hydrolase 43 family protein [Spirosomataceae bacterium]
MKKIALIVLVGIAPISAIAQKSISNPYRSEVWGADKGDGTYKNPIINADYSDPDVIRVGNDYYLVASSFNCTPGLPILHSNDMVNWKILSYALKKQIPLDNFDKPQHGKGVWAPTMKYHKGEFYIYYPDPDFGIYMIKTKNPEGEWSKPLLVLSGKGIIDPSVLWDDDGKAYLTIAWAASRAGINSMLTLYQMNAEGTAVIDEGKHIFDGHEKHPTLEGPRMYKRNGYYYIFAPAGGVATGWQLILRSKNIYGPYEEKVVLAQGNSPINGPHQGAWVQTQTGEDWFFHFQDKGTYGRVVHLQPIHWVAGWPVMGSDKDGDGKGEPVLTYKKPNVGKQYPIQNPVESDEFNRQEIGLQWQWHANPKIQWSSILPNQGFLRLFAYPTEVGAKNLWTSGNLLLQKFPADSFVVTTNVKYTVEWDIWQEKKAGLLIMGNDYAYVGIAKNEKGYVLRQVVCKDALTEGAEKVIEEKEIKTSTAYLRVEVKAPNALCQFSYSEDGNIYYPIGQPFMAKPDKWIGAKVGVFCNATSGQRIGGYADFDWFRITKK